MKDALVSKTFGRKVKELRISRGWTQQELAKKVNLTQSAIHRIEKEQSKQSIKFMAFSKVFNVHPEILYTCDDDEERSRKFSLLKQVFPDWKNIIPRMALSVNP